MNLLDLKEYVDRAIANAYECNESPSDVLVSIQVDKTESESLWADDIELVYDNNGQASGCVIHGWVKEPE